MQRRASALINRKCSIEVIFDNRISKCYCIIINLGTIFLGTISSGRYTGPYMSEVFSSKVVVGMQ